MSRGSVNEHHCRRVAGGPFDLRGTLAGPYGPSASFLTFSTRSTIEGSSRSSPTSLSLTLSLFGPCFPLVSSLKINARTRTHARLFPPRSFLLFLPLFVSLLAFFFPFPPSLARTIFIYETSSLSLSLSTRSILSISHPSPPLLGNAPDDPNF